MIDALAVPPAPPSVEDTVDVVLFFAPATVPVTFTKKVHELFGASVAPVRLTLPEPAVATITPPPHEPESPFGVETTSPAGRLSVKAIPVNVVAALGFVMVKLKLVELPVATIAALKALTIEGGFGFTTVIDAVVVFPVPPFVEDT